MGKKIRYAKHRSGWPRGRRRKRGRRKGKRKEEELFDLRRLFRWLK